MADKSALSLNSLKIPDADGPPQPLTDYSSEFLSVDKVTVVFRDHRAKLKNFISRHDFIFGAVAWFTDEEVIKSLRGKVVSIIVQKEDFLKPDRFGTVSTLQSAYGSVESKLTRYGIPGQANMMSFACSPEVEAFRCVGNYNRDKKPAFPRMHNKFLVGGRISVSADGEHSFVPEAVWTGSYNISYNAQLSFENALMIEDRSVATAYVNEWSQILALSERLNWESDWAAPEYRIGS
ncbi:phospholipase D-like domain-containing protein [Pseudotabrizicola formosa]|uniref:phospholipase D-like domain-containing protein n=1 Tax=Pseudotabrizicola formosa TaxID=2030009 RepID=UPI0011AFBE51|nr:phospholipase D-like domain-containing protein [Pseudotabrizicola formosa]